MVTYMPPFFSPKIFGALMSLLFTLPHTTWEADPNKNAVNSLEEGKILFFPQLQFRLKPEETPLISSRISNGKAKNVSYNFHSEELKGANANSHETMLLKNLLHRFAANSTQFLQSLIPEYKSFIQIGRTSLRPIEVEGRKAPSYKKDDARLHVDAFPANPNQGKRILRIFCNIHPEGKPRVWRVGSSFEEVARTFLPKIPRQFPGSGAFLKTVGITKSLRTPYDHIMLNIHDRMKKSLDYQNSVPYTEIAFHAPSTWMVYTDQVSHAALSGQHLLEQTYYLPISSMADESRSPLRILERLTGLRDLLT